VPRPARFSVDELLDAAAALLAADGTSGVTMSAVARAVGAPSGSVYHRFPTRAALCGELWIRTEQRFHRGFADALTAPGSSLERCIAAAEYTVRWCRDRRDEAQVLLVGADALELSEWPTDLSRRHRALRRAREQALAGVHVDNDHVHAAVIDVPYGLVRRYLVARKPIPRAVDGMAEACVRALLASRENP
jgi:AcrR family transcriptional regulator